MSNYPIHRAVVVALALGDAAAAVAQAQTYVDITGVPSANILYISGSTAIDPGLTSYTVAGNTAICDTYSGDPQPSFYYGTTSGIKFSAVACQVSSTFAAQFPVGGFPLPSNTQIAIIKEDNGGSQFGIDPVRDDSALPVQTINGATVASAFPDFTTLTTTPQPAGHCLTTATAGIFRCVGYASAPTHPNLGYSDVEPAMFQDSLVNTSTGQTATQFDTLDVIFAPAVNVGLYHELQSAEGFTVGSDLAANMPQLTKSQLTGIYNGSISSWASFFPNILTTPVQWGTTGTSFGSSANPSSASVYLCQLGQTSGTERMAEIFFENQNCASGTLHILSAPASCALDGCTFSSTTAKDFAGNGTGDVLACLQGQDKVGHLAIGFASIGNGWGTLGIFQSNTTRSDFRYIRYNAAVPSIETVAAGQYDFWAQGVGILPPATNANVAVGIAGDLVTYFSTGVTKFGSVASLANVNSQHVYESGNWDGGFLSIPTETTLYSAPSAALTTFEGNPENTQTKIASNGTNNCENASTLLSTVGTLPKPTWLAPPLF